MYLRHWIVLLCLISTSARADFPQQMAAIGDLPLTSGETLYNCEIGYLAAGTLNADKSNVIVFPTWFIGTSAGLVQSGLIGPGKLADTDRYFVIAIDSLGNGVSTSPSNSTRQPGAAFPAITIKDMVNAQHTLLTAHLGIDHVMAVMGISMGGMQTFQWIGQYPEFMNKAVVVEGSPRMTSYDLVQWQTHETAIELMQQAGISNAKIMEFLATASLVTLWTPDYFVENISPEAFPAYLAGTVQDYAQMDATNYLVQLRAMMAHDVYADAATEGLTYPQQIKSTVLVVGVKQDHMVNPTPGRILSESIDAGYAPIDSNCGHMGSSCKNAEVTAIVHTFLEKQKEPEP